ncbi:hypothetical protein C8J56DRAFT_895259 [Mycena floridula]|nr:hypothetical protein C8J56DRAFT_895259 [Mycena floridula]
MPENPWCLRLSSHTDQITLKTTTDSQTFKFRDRKKGRNQLNELIWRPRSVRKMIKYKAVPRIKDLWRKQDRTLDFFGSLQTHTLTWNDKGAPYIVYMSGRLFLYSDLRVKCNLQLQLAAFENSGCKRVPHYSETNELLYAGLCKARRPMKLLGIDGIICENSPSKYYEHLEKVSSLCHLQLLIESELVELVSQIAMKTSHIIVSKGQAAVKANICRRNVTLGYSSTLNYSSRYPGTAEREAPRGWSP